ncbi:MAG: hypothetical protein COB93_02440 [Sneathiella sp.]|nr:MAG: hypothetical protein COB93_02440 [Sneathiella sp.]
MFDIHDYYPPCMIASYFDLPDGSIAAQKVRKIFKDYGVPDLLEGKDRTSDEVSRFRLSAALKSANALLLRLPDHERKSPAREEQPEQGQNPMDLAPLSGPECKMHPRQGVKPG